MGNTHSEAPVQRERDPPLQAAEALRQDGGDDEASRRSSPGAKEEQQRTPPCAAGATAESQQARDAGVSPQLSFSGHQAPASAAILEARAKQNQGKKRKIAKARKWTSGQGAFQDIVVVVDKLTNERVHCPRRTEQDRWAHSPKANEGVAPAQSTPAPALSVCQQEKELASGNQTQPQRPATNAETKDGANQNASNAHTAGACGEQSSDAGTVSKPRGQEEPAESALHFLSPASQRAVAAKTGKRAQIACTLQSPQSKQGPAKGQNAQAAINGKESPCKLIKLSIIRSPPSPQVTSPATGDKGQLQPFNSDSQKEQGKGKPHQEKPSDALQAKQATADGVWEQPKAGGSTRRPSEPGADVSPAEGPKCASEPPPGSEAVPKRAGSARSEAAPVDAQGALGQGADVAPWVPAGRLKTHSFLNKRTAHAEQGSNGTDKTEPAVDLPPLPPCAKAATATHRAKQGAPSGISYAEALKQVPLLRSAQEVRYPTKEVRAQAKKEAEATSPDRNGAKELVDMAQVQDGAAAAFKKKLPFYEQLIASLKSQTQRQKGTKPQRQILAQGEPSQPKPTKVECELEAPNLLQVPPEPLLLPGSKAQTESRSPQPLQIPSPSSFQFRAHSQLAPPEQSATTKADPKFMQWFQSQQLDQPIFQFQSKLGHRTNPQEQAEATSNVSFEPVCQTVVYPQNPVPMSGTVPQLNTSIQLQSQSWLRQQIEAQCKLQVHSQTQPWSVSMNSPPPLYTQPQLNTQSILGNPASDQFPIWPLLQSQTQAQAKFSAITHLQCQQHPKPTIQTPLQLQISCSTQQQSAELAQSQLPAQMKLELPQPQKQIQVQHQAQTQAACKVQLQPESKGNSKLSAPTQPKMATKPQKHDQFPPKASVQTTSKTKPQPQAKGRKAQPPFLNQQPLQRQEPVKVQAETEPAAEEKSSVRRPTGRWSAFQIDKTCTRKCHCRHREDQGSSHLPRNIATWTNSVKEPFCETPWVRTAVLAGSLVAGTKFCMDHFKANNILS